MTRETKIGLMMVGVLVGVFGFLLHKRLNRPLDLRAEPAQQLQSDADSTGGDEKQHPQTEDPFVEKPNRVVDNLGRDIELASHNIEATIDDFVDERQPKSARTEQRQTSPISVEQPLETEEQIAVGHWQDSVQSPRDRTSQEQKSGHPDNLMNERLPSEDATSTDTSASDPFENLSTDEPLPRIDYEKQPTPSNPQRNDRVQRTSPVGSSFQPVSRESDISAEETAEIPDPPSRTEFTPREKSRQAPVSLPSNQASAIAEADFSEGNHYTIRKNDSFWSISKKRYGAGRYYMALAKHNEQTIPDPMKMKPGLVIETPDAAILDRLYADVISRPADDSANSTTTTQSRNADDSDRPGYFVAENGDPMYRVGPHDTLSEIATNHLHRTSRWVQIREMNRNVLRDGNELKTGTVLRLPADASPKRIERAKNKIR